MTRTWSWIAAGALLLGLSAAGWLALRGERPVHVLLITLDTTRADRVGCYGYEGANTPHLDGLARRGVVFERAYAPAPMTAPSHTSMMTGLWPPEHGVYTNAAVRLDDAIPTLAELLAQRGYRTAAFPAASMLSAKYGLQRGFQDYYDDFSDPKSGVDKKHRSRDGRSVAELAIQWLTRQLSSSSRRPVFCWLHFYDPHDPYLAHPEDFGDQFDNQLYDGELAYVDLQIGRVLDALNQTKTLQDTVIFVAGDHGESLGEHGEDAHGYLLHDSTLRVPLIVVDPRGSNAGGRVATPVSLVDLFPTILEAAGTQVPPAMKPRSLQPALAGKPLVPRNCYSQTDEPYLLAMWSRLQCLTSDRWRYVRSTKPELYDLQADPRELVNLADRLPDRVSEFDGELAAFEAKFQKRAGRQIALSNQDLRALESLGYAGGASSSANSRPEAGYPDVKDMISHVNEFHDAAHLIDEERYDEAATILEPLAQNVPGFLRAQLNLAQCRIAQENFEDAIRWCESALQADERSERALHLLGYAYLKLRRLDPAEKTFQQLLELNPNSEDGNLYLAETFQRQEKFPLAMQYYEAVLKLNPRNESARKPWEALKAALGPRR